ncbi:hypothetical protein Sgly_1085 [Syntrophobotulus glycolicus DSM 8271]|uniref:Uncharacterized protein n=1 Tax=Syntrophobotulus glycolicus (strain DSM 8271 / FlGlyR) TaxID=645991 RepID=F0SU27_SYNGF|nr:hypothetical protein Sgly_1085 [Syntrophobotulus glycolicus DSM 8271]
MNKSGHSHKKYTLERENSKEIPRMISDKREKGNFIRTPKKLTLYGCK